MRLTDPSPGPHRSTLASFSIALASGAALSLAYPEPDIAPLAWLAPALLLLISERVPMRRACALGLVFGLGFFGALLVWISIVGWVAWAVLVAAEAAFIGGFAALWSLTSGRGRVANVVLPPVLWVAVEFARSNFPVGGFTWGQISQSQHDLAWLLRAAALAGGWGLSFLVVLASSLLAEAWRSRRRRVAAVPWIVGAVAVLAWPLALPEASAGGEPVRVAIVQGNVPRAFAGDPVDKELAILESHVRLTERAAASRPDLVVWPESAVGLDVDSTPLASRALAAAARAARAPLIVGGVTDVDARRYQVMVFQVSPRGEVVDRYQKTHLVPFGEYVPGRSLLGWIPLLDQVPRDAVAGHRIEVFEAAGGQVAPVLSFEGDFGSLVRRRMAAGGRLLIVATNTSTWGRSWASAQHLAFSQLRAAENGVWVVHAAVSGISAFVAPDGSVVDEAGLYREGVLVADLRFAEDITPYARLGDWLPWACVIASAVAVLASLLRRRRGGGGEGVEGASATDVRARRRMDATPR